jgi:outer membrane protein assembly factor BamD (BamD/ComL family)
LVNAPADSLAEEVRLLAKAEADLSSGRFGEAARTLSEHERRFPMGELAEERMAARIQALCALGRTDEATAALAKLARAFPRSSHLDGVEKACGIGAP